MKKFKSKPVNNIIPVLYKKLQKMGIISCCLSKTYNDKIQTNGTIHVVVFENRPSKYLYVVWKDLPKLEKIIELEKFISMLVRL